MKKIVKTTILTIILIQVLYVSFMFMQVRSCNERENNISIYGDFLYRVVYYDKNDEEVAEKNSIRSCVRILGLSDAGKNKATLSIPEYINDIKVEELGNSMWFSNQGIWDENDILNKISIPSSVKIRIDVFENCTALKKVIILINEVNKNYLLYQPTYVTSYFYNENDVTNVFDSERGNLHFANVSYLYNYDRPIDKAYYWIDDYDYGEKIEFIPPEPTRDGYEFGGWYKESECINAWDFDVDTLPEVKYVDFVPQHQEKHDKDNKTLYQETKLYAKWIEKGE